MFAQDMITKLQELIAKFGNLKIGGGSIHDDRGPRRILVLDKNGCETDSPEEAHEFFLEP